MWRPLLLSDLNTYLTAAEQNMLNNASGAKPILQTRLNDAIATFDSAMYGAGYAVGAPPLMIDLLRTDCVAYTIGEFIRSFPKLDLFWTKQRADAYAQAKLALKAVSKREYGALEPPAGVPQTGFWSSNPRVLGRMWPGQQPQQQWSAWGEQGPYASNPNSQGYTVELTAPDPPKNLVALAQTGAVGELVVFWAQPLNAFTFALYMGTASGQETNTNILPAAMNNVTSYTVTGLASGQPYFFVVTASNSIGTSANSNEATATPN